MDNRFEGLVETSERWMRSWKEQDRAALEAVLAENYSLVIASAPGERFERDRWLEIAVGPYKCSRFAYSDILLRDLGGGIVAMSAIADFDATMNGVDRSGRFFVTDLWRRGDDGWKACARFSSPMQADAASIREMVASS